MSKKAYQINPQALHSLGRFFLLIMVLLPGLTAAQLAGTYTIGSGGDFASFSDAVDSLQSQGIDSIVVFNVLSGTYREHFVISEIVGADSANTITFQSLAGVADSVVLWDSTTADTNYVVKLDGADYITFRKMTFESYGMTYARIFHLENDARHIAIVENVFNAHFSGTPSTNQVAIYSPSGLTYSTHDILIEGNMINGSGYGIYLQGRGWSVYYDDSTRIIGNTLDIIAVGIQVSNHHAPLIEGNEIHETAFGDGILLDNCSGALRVLRNRVYFRAYSGITISGCQGTSSERGLIANNFVRNTGPSTRYLGGISINQDSPYQDVFHNTVIFESVTSYRVFAASNIGYPASNVRVLNNNFVCLDAVVAYHHETFPSPMVTVSDYNNIYNASNSLAYWGVACPNLDSLRSVSGQDLHSISVYPMFPDLNHPYTTHPWLDGAGTPLPEVAEDIDGNPRDSIHPDIGCCEFTSDPGVTPYSGTLVIGGGGDFASFSETVDSLTFRGVSGSVIVNASPGDYNEQLKIRSIPGVSWQDTVVFQSSTGNPEDVVLHHVPASGDDNENYTVRIYGADHLCFRAVTLFSDTSSSAPYHRVVDFFGEAENIQFRDNLIYGPPYHTIGAISNNYLIRMDNSYGTRRLIIDNYFEGGSDYSVFASGGDQTGLVVRGNSFARLRRPIWLEGIYGPTIIGNVMTEIFPTSAALRKAVTLYQCDGPIRIEKNQIYVSGGSCLELRGCSATADEPGLIANNFFRAGGGTGEKHGFVFRNSSHQDFYYNSINIIGSSAPTNGRCIYLRSSNSNLQIVNNILCNSCDGYSYYVEEPAAITVSDYNDIYTTGSHVASWGGVDIPDLDSLTAAGGNDSSSVSADPGFVSDFDLHVTSAAIDSMASPLTEVTDDIDGELRDPGFPDIGADEFTPGVNYPPVITSEPDTIAYVDSVYQYQVIATDQNGDTLTYSLSVAPSWLTINDSTGLIGGTPTQSDVGDTTVSVVVDDGHGGSDNQTYTLHVLSLGVLESPASQLRQRFMLFQNYPNPFTLLTRIRFEIPKAAFVELHIYDALGRRVATLVDEELNAGHYETEWNGQNHPIGVYYYRLKTETFSNTRKMLLIR